MKKYSVFLIVFIFFMLYHPPLLTINSLHIVGAISWLYIFYYWKSITKLVRIKKIVQIYILLVLVMFYVFLSAYINGNSFTIVSTYLFWMIDILPGCILITHICLKKKYTVVNLLTLLLIVGSIQGLLSFLTFTMPGFQSYFIERMMAYGYEERLSQLSEHRMFGIASFLTFTTPIIQSMFAMIAIYLSIRVNFKYLCFVPLLLFSSLINARSSIVIILVGVLIYLVILVIDRRKIMKSFSLVSIVFIFALSIFNFIKIKSPITYVWINDGLNEIKYFLNGENIGYFNYITDANKYHLPEGFSLLLGKGVRPLGDFYYNTDVGWVNDIWVSGIFVSIIVYLFFLKILIKIYLSKDEFLNLNKFIAMFFIGTLIFSNFKGAIFIQNEITTVVFLVYIFVINMPNNRIILSDKD